MKRINPWRQYAGQTPDDPDHLGPFVEVVLRNFETDIPTVIQLYADTDEQLYEVLDGLPFEPRLTLVCQRKTFAELLEANVEEGLRVNWHRKGSNSKRS